MILGHKDWVWQKQPEQQQQGGGGGGSSNQNTSFQRTGNTNTQKSYTMPSSVSALFSGMAPDAQVSPTTSTNQQNFISGLLTKDNTQVPGGQTLQSVQGINPTGYTGQPTTANMAAIDPTSAAYENATNEAFLKRMNDSLAQARSGTDIVRGGVARQGFREGEVAYRQNLERSEELRRAKVQDFGMANAATNTANTVETARRGQQLQAQGQQQQGQLGQQQQSLESSKALDSRRNMNVAALTAVLEALGIKNTNVQEALQGSGNQSGSQSGWEAGVSCCFIFLESFNGRLPWWVRAYRDTFGTERMRSGYRRIARLLVPLMRRSVLVRYLTNRYMVLPLTCFGGWFYKVPGYEQCERFAKYKRFWFATFNLLGGF